MDELTFTPTPPEATPRRGAPVTSAWSRYNTLLSNPALKSGEWYDLKLDGLSLHYARKLAIKRGFTTSARKGVLAVKWKGA